MRRTALVVAMLLAVAATFLYLLGVGAVFALACCIFIAAVVLWLSKRRSGVDSKSIFVLLITVLLCVWFIIAGIRKDNTVKGLDGKTGKVVCTVIEEPEHNGGYTELYVKIKSFDNASSNGFKGVKFKLLIHTSSPASSAEIGDIIKADAAFEIIDPSRAKYSYYRGIYLQSWCYSAEIDGHADSLYEHFVNLRKYIRGTVYKHLSGDSAALMNALILGDSAKLSDELYYNFKACGLSHLIAVSGLHINIICLALYGILSKLMGRQRASAVMFIPLIVMVAVTGFTPSAIRAGIMFAIFLLGRLFLKNPDSLNSLGTAMTVMLAVNPYYISSISFQLSCAATAGIIISAKPAEAIGKRILKNVRFKLLNRVLKLAIMLAIFAVAANLFTLPFTALHFGFISLVSPIVSVFVTPAATYLLTLGVLGVVLSAIPFLGFYLSAGVFWLADILTDYTAVIARVGASIPFSYIPVDYKMVYLWLGGTLGLIAVWILLGQIGGKRVVSFMSVTLLVLVIVGGSLSNINSVKITVLNTETQCLVLTKNRKCMVFGLNGENRAALETQLKLYEINQIEAVFVTDLEESLSTVESLRQNYTVNAVLAIDGDSVTPGDKCEPISGVAVTLIEKDKLQIDFLDKTVVLMKADSFDEIVAVPADVRFAEFNSGSRKAVLNGGEVITLDGEWAVTFKEGKDMIFNGR